MNLTIAHVIAILFVGVIVLISLLLGEYNEWQIIQLGRINLSTFLLQELSTSSGIESINWQQHLENLIRPLKPLEHH